MIRDEVYERGLKMRREMFGADSTDAQIDSVTEFTDKFQELVTRHCFGDLWSRDGLTRRERSMITLAMLLALGRPHEIRVHLRGAVANGVTVEEIREILLHCSLYCGIPSMVEGFRAAAEVLEDATP